MSSGSRITRQVTEPGPKTPGSGAGSWSGSSRPSPKGRARVSRRTSRSPPGLGRRITASILAAAGRRYAIPDLGGPAVAGSFHLAGVSRDGIWQDAPMALRRRFRAPGGRLAVRIAVGGIAALCAGVVPAVGLVPSHVRADAG